MTALELFERLAPVVGPTIHAKAGRQDLCIYTARVVIEVAKHFGIHVKPLPVRVVVYNAPFARHVENGEEPNIEAWKADGSYSVGIGYGEGLDKALRPGWNGHMAVQAAGAFGDFSIQQAERPQHGIITGPGIAGAYDGRRKWTAINDCGTTIEYERITDNKYLQAPDWKRNGAGLKRMVGDLIREVKD
jgi:hypothetical protein